MSELIKGQIMTLYKMYLRGLISFSEFVNFICDDKTYNYLKYINDIAMNDYPIIRRQEGV